MNENNLFPEKIIKTRDSEGKSVFSEVYTFQSWGNLTILEWVFILIIGALVGPFFSLLLLVFYCLDAQKTPIIYNVMGILASIYIILDINFDWFLTFVMKLIFTPKELHQIMCLNASLLITHSLLLFIGDSLFDVSGKNKFWLFIYLCGIVVGFYFLMSKFL